jgi:ABC-2 type transport system ATP-binding protein
LLAGTSGVVYKLAVRGDGHQAQQTLTQQPWVTAVSATPNHEDTALQITVDDEPAAETQLLRLVLANEKTAVTEFGRKKYNLEEIFLQMVDGGHSR